MTSGSMFTSINKVALGLPSDCLWQAYHPGQLNLLPIVGPEMSTGSNALGLGNKRM